MDTLTVTITDTRTIHYQIGTLQLDLYDADDGKLVWRGSAEQVLRDNPEPIPVGDATVLHITRADLRAAFDATFIAPMRAAEAELWHALAKRQPATHREPA